MHVVRGTCTLEQVHISNSHLYMLSQGELVLALPQPELSDSHSGTSFRTHALPRQEPSTLCHLENHVFGNPARPISFGQSRSRGEAGVRQSNYVFHVQSAGVRTFTCGNQTPGVHGGSEFQCGGTLHKSPTTWPTNTSVIAFTARHPTLRTTWWTLIIYWDQQLYSDAQ